MCELPETLRPLRSVDEDKHGNPKTTNVHKQQEEQLELHWNETQISGVQHFLRPKYNIYTAGPKQENTNNWTELLLLIHFHPFFLFSNDSNLINR